MFGAKVYCQCQSSPASPMSDGSCQSLIVGAKSNGHANELVQWFCQSLMATPKSSVLRQSLMVVTVYCRYGPRNPMVPEKVYVFDVMI